jgi:UDP-3-O-[3-hydroxymyristoyl] glucosamine N-acyltransferase
MSIPEFRVDGSGGLVHRTAHVDHSARVMHTSTVYADASVHSQAYIAQDTKIGQGTSVGFATFVGAKVCMAQGSTVGDRCWVGHDAYIGAYAQVRNGVSIASGSSIEARQVITQDTIAITGIEYECTLSEHGIKLGCNFIRTPEEWNEIPDLGALSMPGDEAKYRPCLDAAIALWYSYFEWK